MCHYCLLCACSKQAPAYAIVLSGGYEDDDDHGGLHTPCMR